VQAVVSALQDQGAVFAFLHGSRVTGSAGPTSDVDVAAFFGTDPPPSFEVLLPEGVDLLVLDTAPLELAGVVALHGQLLFEDDVAARVQWQAMTPKIYLDELPRLTRSHREFAQSRRRG